MKTMKSYRMKQSTLDALKELSKLLKRSETAVIDIAITELYLKHYYVQDTSTAVDICDLLNYYNYTKRELIEVGIDKVVRDYIKDREEDEKENEKED